MSRQEKDVEPTNAGCLAGLVRFIWLIAGNGALCLLIIFIFEEKAASGLDVAFWTIVASLIAVRYIDITRLNGLTSDGEPATLQHWRRYALVLLAIAGTGWALAHGINRLLT
jgi:hypothetical protein